MKMRIDVFNLRSSFPIAKPDLVNAKTEIHVLNRSKDLLAPDPPHGTALCAHLSSGANLSDNLEYYEQAHPLLYPSSSASQ